MISRSPNNKLHHDRRTTSFQDKVKNLLGGVCCLLLLLTIVLSIPVYALRIIVTLLTKIFRPDLGDILNGISSNLVNDYFYNKKSPRASIIVSFVIRGQDFSIQELKETLIERWIRAKDIRTGKLRFEQFQQYPVRWMGFTFWKNYIDTFYINNHVFLEKQSDDVNDEKLNNICEKILNAPYPSNQSPWEVHLVKNYKSDQFSMPNNISRDQATFVLLFKVHHCLADGYSMLNALVDGFGQHSLTNVKLPVPTTPKRNFWESTAFYATFPFNAFYEFSYALSHIFRSSPWKVPDNKKEWYQFCAKSDYIPIQKVKFIKTHLQVSFTSVLLSAISSAIFQSIKNARQRNLDREPEGIFENDQDDCSMYCASLLPVPGHSNRLTNRFTNALFDLPIDEYESCVDRIHDVDEVFEFRKNTCLPAFIPWFSSAIGCNFYYVVKFLGPQRIAGTGLTNFPGLPIKVEQNGRKYIAADFMVGALDGVGGVGTMVLSYGEYIRVAATAEKAVMSKEEVNRFVKDVVNEIDQLYLSCCTNR